MTAIDAIILGIVEGLTEFLPVSSTGHMILVRPLLGIDGDTPLWHAFLFVSQFGAILAVILYFWRKLWSATARLGQVPLNEYMPAKLAVAVIPAILLGLAFNSFMERHLEGSSIAVAGGLIVGALIMEFIDRRYRSRFRMRVDQVSMPQALIIGLAQCLSMWPGTSRAMVTIMAGMVVGLPPAVATEFSFYLAIPTILLASAYKLYKHANELDSQSAALIITGAATAFVVALLVVAAFMRYVRTRRFTPFAVYRVILGVLVLWFASRSGG